MTKTKKTSRAKPRRAKGRDDLPTFKDGREFDSLSDADKDKVWNYYNREIPMSETREPTAVERIRMNRIRKAGRPKIGEGAKLVAVTIEKGLLKRADNYAKGKGMKRAELIARGLMLAMGEAIRPNR